MADDTAIRARWLKKLAARRKLLAAARGSHNRALAAVRAAKRVLGRHPAAAPKPPTPAPSPSPARLWHPRAVVIRYSSAGPFVNGRPKLVWHTTEGSSLPSYSGSAPHFTFDPKTGKLYQHIPLNESAKALEHPAGTPETNRAHAIQVELIAYSDTALARRQGHPERAVVNFTAADYARIAALARWIEGNAHVPRTCGVQFTVPAKRLSGQAFVDYAGHIGHCHVPGNSHWDPGQFRIAAVLA